MRRFAKCAAESVRRFELLIELEFLVFAFELVIELLVVFLFELVVEFLVVVQLLVVLELLLELVVAIVELVVQFRELQLADADAQRPAGLRTLEVRSGRVATTDSA
jgi:hypothetical protein